MHHVIRYISKPKHDGNYLKGNTLSSRNQQSANSFNQVMEGIILNFEDQVIESSQMNERLNPKPEIDYSEEAKARDLAELKRLEQEMAASEQRMAELEQLMAELARNRAQEKAKLEQEIAENNRKLAEHNKRICYFTRILKHCYATARPVQSTVRQGHCRASASRTRTTGSNAKKATSGSGGDPDPEPRRQPRLSGLFALRNVLTACRTLIATDTHPEVLV